MSKKTTWFVLAIPTIFVLGCVVFLFTDLGIDNPVHDGTELDEAAKDRLASEAAIRQIAAESNLVDAQGAGTDATGTDLQTAPAVEAVAPPGFQPAPLDEGDPTPPEGYAFSSYHEVTRTRLTEADREDLRKPTAAPDWMDRGHDALADAADAHGRDWTFGWAKLADGAEPTDLAALLAAQGGEAIGQAGDLVRVRLPADRSRLEAIASAGAVAGIGAVPPHEKVTGTLRERALADASEQVPVWITLMDDDPDGAWRRDLQGLGAVVGRFDPAIRAYAATIPLTLLGPVSSADYVLGVESIGRVRPTLATATAAMGADWARVHDADTGLFTGMGGASAPVGVMDTGLNVEHLDISSNRRSICGANFVARGDRREEDQDLWFDFDGHGTAVTGVVAGSGTANPVHAGMAPMVQDIRFAKALGSTGAASGLSWTRALDWFATPTACGDDMPRKALVLNSSLGVSADIWEARSYFERKLDASVWSSRQLFVTSAGNGSDAVFTSMSGAKNSLSVGATQTIGDIASFSSHGPTEDGRLVPNVVGTGVLIMAARGGGSRDGYGPNSGTSFSSPSVVGVAALLMDAVPELMEEPAALRARLMATAIKPDAWLGTSSAFALDNTGGPGSMQNIYGLGKVSGRTAILDRDTEDGWTGGSTAFDVDADSYASHDIVVPEGASRLEVVLTWDEPPAETIANSVLNDLDLWVDFQSSCGATAKCGRFHSVSAVDNVEWVVVPNPRPGLYRVKVTPSRVHGAPPRAGLAWNVIRGDSTPTLGVSANAERIDAAPDEPFEVEVTMTSDGYVAAGANLRVDCRAEAGSRVCDDVSIDGEASALVREDNVERDLEADGLVINVGEIGPDEEQVVTLAFPGQPAGSFRLYLAASGWNAESGATSVAVVVGDPGADAPAPVERPANDDYWSATVLDSEGGDTTFDLVAATPGPGDPSHPLRTNPERHRSLWYVWTAPDHGLARFTVAKTSPDDYSDGVMVEVFRDGRPAGLEAVGTVKQGGGASFYADRGETYRLRLSVLPNDLAVAAEDAEGNLELRPADTPPLTLKWGPAAAPVNDHYADAAMVDGETGHAVGNNQGATTEPGEFLGDSSRANPVFVGGWSSSVWYRWTAPSSGDWTFSVDRRGLLVSAFVGDDAAGARLVSGAPGTAPLDPAVFPATEGVEYHIGVASATAYLSGNEFMLSWAPGERADPGNDDFAAAMAVEDNAAETRLDFNALTVEHGEPAESGVRTAWYTWQPQAGARHTWNVSSAGTALGDAVLRISVFKGSELAALEPVAAGVGDNTDMRLAFDTEMDASYALALGVPRDSAQVSLAPAELAMQLGMTPANDDRADAILLAGTSGSVTGSNEFATNEPGEFTGTLGDSSLWWTLEPAEAGWIRLVAAGLDGLKLAIYRTGADGGLELLHTSRSLLEGQTSVNFNAEAGVRYTIRLGSYIFDADGFGGRDRGEFELSWGPGAPPARLAFVEAVEGGEVDGGEVGFDGLGSQAFNADGTELYVASESGILVFGRDADTGKLTLEHMLEEHPIGDQSVQLLWDEAGSALLVASCDGWARFTPAEGGGIEHAGEVAGGPCPTEPLMIGGPFVHDVVAGTMIETYEFNDDRTALESVEQVTIDNVSKAAMTSDGSHVYAVAGDFLGSSLTTFERDGETGSLTLVSTVEDGAAVGDDGTVVEGLAQPSALAVHMSHLFVSSGTAGADTAAFDLDDAGNPAFVGRIDAFLPFVSFFADCGNSSARQGTGAVDVFCAPSSNFAFTVQAGADSVFPGDLVSLSGFATDAFGNDVAGNDEVYSLAASPDGRHLYVAGFYSTLVFFPVFEFIDVYQMLVFERRLGD